MSLANYSNLWLDSYYFQTTPTSQHPTFNTEYFDKTKIHVKYILISINVNNSDCTDYYRVKIVTMTISQCNDKCIA